MSILLNTITNKKYTMTKVIKVSEPNHKRLNELKTEMDCKSINEVITHLIEANDKLLKAKTIMVIE